MLPSPRLDIGALYSKSSYSVPINNSEVYYSLPSFSSSVISCLCNSEGDSSFSSHYNVQLDLSKLPANCILRINQLDPGSFQFLDLFDHIFVVKRSKESLLLSNLLDLPPAFEALSIDQVQRFELAKVCGLDKYWIQCLSHYIETQDSIIQLVKHYTNKVSIIDFDSLVSEHRSVLKIFSERLGISHSDQSLKIISSSLLHRSHSRWSSHYRKSSNNSHDPKLFLSEILSPENNIPSTHTYLSLLANYKKIVFCGEFRYPFDTAFSKEAGYSDTASLKISCMSDTLNMPANSSLTVSHD